MNNDPEFEATMPVLFVGHGSPMNAIEDNAYSRAWMHMGRSLPRPRAIVCISAHWETAGTHVTAMDHPATLYDFSGFPRTLYALRYPCPGSAETAGEIRSTLSSTKVFLDFNWGLDHGAWSVLCRMFPRADVPVVQLSLDINKNPAQHYELGRELKALRRRGFLVLGSGNMVHNLRTMVWQDTAFDWALAIDERLQALIAAGEHQALVDYRRLGPASSLAIPTNEHYLPLLYILACSDPTDSVRFFADQVTLGSVSMRSVIFQPNS